MLSQDGLSPQRQFTLGWGIGQGFGPRLGLEASVLDSTIVSIVLNVSFMALYTR